MENMVAGEVVKQLFPGDVSDYLIAIADRELRGRWKWEFAIGATTMVALPPVECVGIIETDDRQPGRGDVRERFRRNTVTTFVLIHGAYQGGWIWKLVASRLRAGGHLVYAPSLDGCGERSAQLRPGITTETQADEVAGFLWSEDLRNVVLVGASAGGMVMAKTAELAGERIARLVFCDALALMHGEKIRDIVPGPGTIETDLATGPTREERLTRFLLDLDRDLAEWAADRSGVHPIATFNQPVVLEKFWDQDWDSSVVFCRRADRPGEAHKRRAAARLGANWHELDTGHFPMLSMPDALTRIILDG